jgi:hypothetical protein
MPSWITVGTHNETQKILFDRTLKIARRSAVRVAQSWSFWPGFQYEGQPMRGVS